MTLPNNPYIIKPEKCRTLADTKSGNHYIRILIWSKIKRVRKKRFIADILTIVFSEIEGYVFKIHSQVYFPFCSSETRLVRYFMRRCVRVVKLTYHM